MSTTFAARYFDGESIRSYGVQVSLQKNAITINFEDIEKKNPIVWSSEELLLLSEPIDNRQAMLGSQFMPKARLIMDSEHYNQLQHLISKSNIHHGHVTSPWRTLILIAIICTAALFGFLWSLRFTAPWVAQWVPPSWDDRLGRYVVKKISTTGLECIDPAGKRALQTMVISLSKHHNVVYPFDVKVLEFDKKLVNAFAVPGFHIIIMHGLISFADSPDEVAGVLAHEMGHALKHHPTEGLIHRLTLNLIMTAAFGSTFDLGTEFLSAKHTREHELEADNIAIQLLKESNVSNKGLLKFFNKMKKDEDDIPFVNDYFGSHPATKLRIEAVQQMEEDTKLKPILSDKEWKDLKGICKKKKPIRF